jgi:ribosomal protein S18 acetylase RimI-like enzyme
MQAVPGIREQWLRPAIVLPSDLDAVASDLSAAFADYSLFRWILRDNGDNALARRKLFEVLVRDIGYRTGEICRPATGGAAAIWVRSQDLDRISFIDEIRMLPPLVAATGLRRLPRLVALDRAINRHHPKCQPHVYLYLLGVHPRLQGTGIGSRLLQAGLDRIDTQGCGAFLETSTESNVFFYRHFGFKTVETYRVDPGSPSVWAMWRPPTGYK